MSKIFETRTSKNIYPNRQKICEKVLSLVCHQRNTDETTMRNNNISNKMAKI